MKKISVIIIVLVFAAGFLSATLAGGHKEYYEKYEEFKYGFIPYYSTIDKKCSEKDRETAMEIVELAGKIMTDTKGTEFPNAGKLGEYSLKKHDAEHIEVKIQLITADFTFSNGYMWVEYSQEFFTSEQSEKQIKNALAFWKLRKIDGVWTVVKVKDVEV